MREIVNVLKMRKGSDFLLFPPVLKFAATSDILIMNAQDLSNANKALNALNAVANKKNSLSPYLPTVSFSSLKFKMEYSITDIKKVSTRYGDKIRIDLNSDCSAFITNRLGNVLLKTPNYLRMMEKMCELRKLRMHIRDTTKSCFFYSTDDPAIINNENDNGNDNDNENDNNDDDDDDDNDSGETMYNPNFPESQIDDVYEFDEEKEATFKMPLPLKRKSTINFSESQIDEEDEIEAKKATFKKPALPSDKNIKVGERAKPQLSSASSHSEMLKSTAKTSTTSTKNKRPMEKETQDDNTFIVKAQPMVHTQTPIPIRKNPLPTRQNIAAAKRRLMLEDRENINIKKTA